MQVIGGTFLFVALVAWITGVTPVITVAYAMGVWLPVWLAALVLRRTESHAALVMAGAFLGILFALSMYFLVADVGGWWRGNFEALLGSHLPKESMEVYREALRSAEPLFNGMVAAGLSTSLVVTVLAARWWQALLFNP